MFEQLKIIGPLTDPTAHGGRAEDAFDVVIPSMPGYGFSGKPTGTGWDPDRIARAWAELMKRLGYTRYVAQGGDWGSPVSSAMARQAPAGLLGIHINLPATVPPEVAAALAGGGPAPAGLSEKERAAFDALDHVRQEGNRAYVAMMTTRPQTVGYGVTDSPAGLAAWMLVHPGFAQWTYGDDPEQSPTKDEVLDDITLYWLTNTATSSARLYWENGGQQRSSRGRAEDRRDLAAGGHHGISGGGLSRPGDMGPARLSQPDLLPRGRQGRTLRRVGAAGALLRPSSAPRSGRFGQHTDRKSQLEQTKGGPHENNSNHGDSGADRRKRSGAARGAVAAVGNQAHRSPAARSQRPGTRGYPGARRLRARRGVPPHSHPGEEIVYVIEGVLEYQLEGKPPVTLKAGEVLFIPAGTVHSAKNVGSGNAAELATYIVEKANRWSR